MIVAAAMLFTGVAFADGTKKKAKTTCNKHEGKTCSKKSMDSEPKDSTAVPATKN